MNNVKRIISATVLGLLLLGIAPISTAKAAEFPEEVVMQAIPPTRIWHDYAVSVNLGDLYYTEISNINGMYRGYLQLNWQKSIGSVWYWYEGYVYHESQPLPIPARIGVDNELFE